MVIDSLNSPIASKFKYVFHSFRVSVEVDLSYFILVESFLVIIFWLFKSFTSQFPLLCVKRMVRNYWFKDFDLNLNELLNNMLTFFFLQLAVGSYLCFVFP